MGKQVSSSRWMRQQALSNAIKKELFGHVHTGEQEMHENIPYQSKWARLRADVRFMRGLGYSREQRRILSEAFKGGFREYFARAQKDTDLSEIFENVNFMLTDTVESRLPTFEPLNVLDAYQDGENIRTYVPSERPSLAEIGTLRRPGEPLLTGMDSTTVIETEYQPR